MQHGKEIGLGYGSHCLSSVKQKYVECEVLLSCYWAVRQFNYLICGGTVQILTKQTTEIT